MPPEIAQALADSEKEEFEKVMQMSMQAEEMRKQEMEEEEKMIQMAIAMSKSEIQPE